ncbi:uncharacterized protein VTP21DRAFT_1122 [Calcarisporiella thermophila]|uniref:uncharacterized protein n=1 Tax=Calcarisporiella thermophila TaxID=911321 RepID=UPI0037440743
MLESSKGLGINKKEKSAWLDRSFNNNSRRSLKLVESVQKVGSSPHQHAGTTSGRPSAIGELPPVFRDDLSNG